MSQNNTPDNNKLTPEGIKDNEAAKAKESPPLQEEPPKKPADGQGDAEKKLYQPDKAAPGTGQAAVKKAKAPLTPEEQQLRRRRKKRVAIIACVVVVGLLLSMATGLLALYKWVDDSLNDDSDFDVSVLEEVKTANIPEYTGKNIVCGLICGVDNVGAGDEANPQDSIGNTDVILYIMYNIPENKLNILQIPRDIYIGEEVPAGPDRKINGVYAASPDPNNRMGALAKVLMDQLGLPTDFYLKLDVAALRALVDHMGSIEVFVPRDIVDKETGNVLIQEGWRHFTGEETEQFLRNRNYADADMTRLMMQQNFYAALFREFKELSPSDLVMWMRILLYYVDVRGLDPIQIGGLAQKGLRLEGKDITFVRPPVTGAQNGKYLLLSLVPDETADLLNQYFRPDGHVVPVEDLNIYTLPVLETIGKSEAVVRTMNDIRSQEPPVTG